MFPVSKELKQKLEGVNHRLREIYPKSNLSRGQMRERLQQIGTFYQLTPFSGDELTDWLQNRTLVGIDGSVNSTKGAEMRTLSVFQALAKGTRGEESWAADVYTPLLENEEEEERGQAAREARKRGALLSSLEMKVAEQAIEKWSPKVMLMDGSLLHFYIADQARWERVARLAEEKQVFLVGVAEEIGTQRLVKEVFPEFSGWSDRDLLQGVLQVGEAFLWEEWSPQGSLMWKMVMRSTKDPVPIGVDGLLSQREEMIDLIRLVFTLTPRQGRGIPYWLDIVDNQVRVTDALVQTMVDRYIDPDLRYRLFGSKRDERII